jgi:hypothetical protein
MLNLLPLPKPPLLFVFLALLVTTAHAAAPFNTSSLFQLMDLPNATLVKETVVHIQVHPVQEELDLAGVYMHQVTSGLQDWTSRIFQFLKDAFSGGGAPQMIPGSDRRKLYVI